MTEYTGKYKDHPVFKEMPLVAQHLDETRPDHMKTNNPESWPTHNPPEDDRTMKSEATNKAGQNIRVGDKATILVPMTGTVSEIDTRGWVSITVPTELYPDLDVVGPGRIYRTYTDTPHGVFNVNGVIPMAGGAE